MVPPPGLQIYLWPRVTLSFDLLSVVRCFVANNTFQRYVTIENICVSQGKVVTLVRLCGKYLYSIQFSPLCHLPTKTYQSWWKFDEVLTETKMHSFFWRHGVYVN